MLGVPLVLARWLTQHNGQLLALSIIDNDWSRWFAISGSHIFAVPVAVSSKELNVDVRNIFARSHTK
jgi:hypothetical protein